MDVELHIEELVLHGFAAGDRQRIAEAMQLELTRLLSAAGRQSVLARPIALERVNGGAINIQAGAKPEATGAAIARTVFKGLGQQTRAAAAGPTLSAPALPKGDGRG